MRYGAAPRLRRDLITLGVISIAYLAIASVVTNSYYQLILTLVPVWAVFGVSWNILSGYGGQLSFGHAAFFGIGAYTVTLALVYWNLTPWLGIPLGMIVAGIAAVLIGIPTFRLRGHYFALSMLAYPLAILYVLQYLGFQEMSLPMHRENPAAYLEFTEPRLYSVVAVGLLIIGLFVCMVIENSRFGLALLAIRQNELAAEAAGINARLWKMRALVVSGMIAAAAGGFYACVLLVVTPDSVFGMLVSAQAVVVTLFGGVTSVWGPVIGAAILVPLASGLNAQLGNILPGIQGVVYGVAIIGIMLLAPDGLFWTVRDRFFRRPVTRMNLPIGFKATTSLVREPADASAPLLKVDGISRSFGGLRAVSQVSFEVRPGEILGIIGPNGAGKTTLFNLLNGVLTCDEGTATIGGEMMTGRKVHQVTRLGVGRTFQVVRSFPRLPVLDNVIVGAYGAGLSDTDAIASAAEALRRVGLADLAGTAAGQLTNKQLRLMELARALAGHPRLLLLDETLAGLGRDECDDVLDVLERLREEGMTIVIIEHTMHAMMRIADRFVVLDHGRVLASGLPRQVVEDRTVIEAYLGKKWAAKQDA
ncbi:branched-chain amino acid ABC transporter ATP-binding protein/permease [Rhodopila sp.]|uniref:branched-chain amino acid ABC transporter ATP-binding protein/permease n=1 Tax=Rhodopila sp. TaxID=2480087 RepID=UPI002C3CB5ED|nr:branched-chain amino acid ABC transporter ATP-binding protein/permease [Rhodopila sp.]HVZ09361.1 branched-chain amino acid ABC transporter ATP-binding protein/permease [Rhodopila sp.]